MVKRSLAIPIAILIAVLGGCSGPAHFPMRASFARDTDLDPVSVKCERRPSDKDPKHISCAPEPYVSPLAWDGADNSIFRPLAKIWAVDVPNEARNVTAFDEVPDSAWFTNRIGIHKISVDDLRRGACVADQLLDPDSAKESDYVIDQGKANGSSPGFRVKIGGKKKYMFKADSADTPGDHERPTAAAAIGTAVYHAVGFNASCEQVVYVDPKAFKLLPNLKTTGNDGVTKPFDQKALQKILDDGVKQGSKYRFQASAWLDGFLIGPFKYEGTRSDDPNDIIPHEDRRDLRGSRVLAAWLDHFDAREQNSMDTWMAVDKANPESSPGVVKHYYLDTSDCLGSLWAWDGISRRLGDSYLLDIADISGDFASFGAIERPWERKSQVKGFEQFGYFNATIFDPDRWRNEYPNPAFIRATEHDNAWMARILSRFDRADIRAFADIGRFSNPEAPEYITDLLERRLQKILERYLLRLSPISDFHMEGEKLCATDLARRRSVRPESELHYDASLDHHAPLPVEVAAEGKICMTVPHSGSVNSYTVVSIKNGVAKGVVEVHLYDLGSPAGFRVAGVVRPNP